MDGNKTEEGYNLAGLDTWWLLFYNGILETGNINTILEPDGYLTLFSKQLCPLLQICDFQ